MPQLKAAIIEAPHVMMEDHSLEGIAKARTMLDYPDIIKALNRYHHGRAEQLIDHWTSHWLKADLKDWEAIEELKKIHIPLLLIQGDKDEYGTFAQIDRIEEHVKSTLLQIQKVPDCGHIPHLQKQDEVLDFSLRFIHQIAQR
jgi:pimeloyl-ACP methyl ester carboxylesterase